MSRSNADSSRTLHVPSPVLIVQLNELLVSLDLQFTVQSHVQLTPALLVCILESILPSDRPLPISERRRRTLVDSNTQKVHCIKIFLGVLQDILRKDVGLSKMDPRRLAFGEEEETYFIARLLCWYGRRNGLVSRRHSGRDVPDIASPSTLITALTKGTETPLPAEPDSDTPDTSVSAPSWTDDKAGGPRCIHEVPSPSLVLSPSSTHPAELESSFLSDYPQNTTIRRGGYLSLTDEDAQIAAFEEHRRLQRLDKRPQREPHDETQLLDDRTQDDSVLAYEQERKRDLIKRLGKRRQPDPDEDEDEQLTGDSMPDMYPLTLIRLGKRRQQEPHEDQDADTPPLFHDDLMPDTDDHDHDPDPSLAAAVVHERQRKFKLMQRKADLLDGVALLRLHVIAGAELLPSARDATHSQGAGDCRLFKEVTTVFSPRRDCGSSSPTAGRLTRPPWTPIPARIWPTSSRPRTAETKAPMVSSLRSLRASTNCAGFTQCLDCVIRRAATCARPASVSRWAVGSRVVVDPGVLGMRVPAGRMVAYYHREAAPPPPWTARRQHVAQKGRLLILRKTELLVSVSVGILGHRRTGDLGLTLPYREALSPPRHAAVAYWSVILDLPGSRSIAVLDNQTRARTHCKSGQLHLLAPIHQYREPAAPFIVSPGSLPAMNTHGFRRSYWTVILETCWDRAATPSSTARLKQAVHEWRIHPLDATAADTIASAAGQRESFTFTPTTPPRGQTQFAGGCVPAPHASCGGGRSAPRWSRTPPAGRGFLHGTGLIHQPPWFRICADLAGSPSTQDRRPFSLSRLLASPKIQRPPWAQRYPTSSSSADLPLFPSSGVSPRTSLFWTTWVPSYITRLTSYSTVYTPSA
ncbi:hypothetical protein C8F04DRAFT_1197793 [Mycena alexandri]|uniref:Uncharacterized protein n=1 Tax=Mycena alexandri TaxID=1745969 RepID=A0AAD6S183_9AGAR|nr:hypothetical protein C8F04DRAFT_1197793 [Mycena alexandri]